jgi:hypothetical protein
MCRCRRWSRSRWLWHAVLPFMPEGLIFSHWKRPAINGLLCYFMQVFSLFVSLCVYLCMYQTCVYLWIYIYMYIYIYTYINGCVKWTCRYIYYVCTCIYQYRYYRYQSQSHFFIDIQIYIQNLVSRNISTHSLWKQYPLVN